MFRNHSGASFDALRAPSTVISRRGTSSSSSSAPTATAAPQNEDNPALFASLCYRGLEIIFTVLDKKKCNGERFSELACIHSRSRVIFQRIRIRFDADDVEHGNKKLEGRGGDSDRSIVALSAHPRNGIVYVVTSHGLVRSYHPALADPKLHAYGKYRWGEGCHVNVRTVFGFQSGEGPCFCRAPLKKNKNINADKLEESIPATPSTTVGPVILCPSSTSQRVLIVHADQLAIYDFSNEQTAGLLWTHKLGSIIEHASLSGDGYAIVVALRGEGVGVPFPFGVRTFVRDDMTRGSANAGASSQIDAATAAAKAAVGKPPLKQGHVRKRSGFEVGPVENPPLPCESAGGGKDKFDGLLANVFGSAPSVVDGTNGNNGTSTNQRRGFKGGILYKPGPFLVHSAPVTRLAFRGYGTTTSSYAHNNKSNRYLEQEEEGNDLLLTTCSSDSSVRIFSQNSWRQLMQWNSPPKSRADWVRGISAANLGDLDTSPTSSSGGSKSKKTTSKEGLSPIPKDITTDFSTQYKRHPSSGSVSSETSAGINRALLGENLHQTPNPSAIPSHSEPGTHAGAWIAELTFRNAFPALRLSRLSYMKSGGDDALPAHFESVAAILPAGSVEEEVALEEGWGEGRLQVEGIWPLWDPWETEGKSGGGGSTSKWVSYGDGHPSGNGEAPRWLGDGADLGGSHVPPSELRITSSHLRGDRVTQIEMPLWGDKDFGAMEFGSPIKHVITMPGIISDPRLADLPCANLEFEAGSRLCARASLDRRSIDLWWRKHGAINLEEDLATPTTGPQLLRDISLTPLPLCLPTLTLPGKSRTFSMAKSESLISYDKHSISSLCWWPDENFGGPPRLVAFTQGGTLIVYEMPPPWSALEPPMPSYDPFDDAASRGSSAASDFGMNQDDEPLTVDSFDEGNQQLEYEVSITPHPDFGIGLRLEAQAGMPAIAGSFKKNPLSGGRLPAERAGAIALGDELLAVNDVNLEGYSFEDAIATVRRIGFDSFGVPLRMRFRRCKGKKSRGSGPTSSAGSKASRRQKVSAESESQATLEVGAGAENQQEFGRIIAIVRDVVVGATDQSCPPAVLLIPWNFGKGAVVSNKMYGGALILWAVPGQRIVKAGRLEVVLDIDPENARFVEIGSIHLEEQESKSQSTIKSMSFVNSTEKGWLVATHDSTGSTSLLFIETFCTEASGSNSVSNIKAKFRNYPSVFNVHEIGRVGNKTDPKESFIFRAFSLELFGCIGSRHQCKELTIWTAFPETKHQVDTSLDEAPYKCSKININNVKEVSDEVILDFRWIRSGFHDAFPWLILFTSSAALLYRRPSNQLIWQPITILFYESGLFNETISPHDAFPHLTSALRSAVHINDEQNLLRSDWHPESIIANICTEREGVHLALKSHTHGLYKWLAQWMNPEESMRPSWVANGSLSSAPFRIVNEKTVMQPVEEETENGGVESSANLMTAMSLNKANAKPPSVEERALSELQKSLCPFEESRHDPAQNIEFSATLSSERAKQKVEDAIKKPLPTPLQGLNKDEQACVWVIGDILCNMPSFKKLDTLSQLCLFSVTLMRRLLAAKDISRNQGDVKQQMISYEGGRPVFLHQRSNVNIEQTDAKFDTAASAAFLAALMSDTQSRLIDSCRPPVEKLNWESARSVGIPFWVRSEKALAVVAEEIAQTIYKSSKSVMDCALYYIAMRNMNKLRAIAATDKSDSGKKFFKFITDHDFRSERGRKAAEKNAYSLLRKRKYASAASFFLLAEPPMITSALDIIKSQMQDISLAFFVARLVEYSSRAPTVSTDTLTIGGGFNLSSMGGGGGFAGSGSVSNSPVDAEDDPIKFCEWSPCLSTNARDLLIPHIKNSPNGDNCFDCLQLLWLNRPNDAMLRLAHMTANRETDDTIIHDCVTPFISSCEAVSSETSAASWCSSIVKRANAVINFCSGPSLLKVLKPQKRILWTSALLVSSALNRCGIEIPSIRILIEIANPHEDEKYIKSQVKSEKESLSEVHRACPQGSPHDAPPVKAKAKAQPVSDVMSSSIFDAFDAPPPKLKVKEHHVSDMSSSIFDAFDAPQPKPKAKPQTASDNMSSSIFDAFDSLPPKSEAKHQPASGNMSSSIFDSFDVPPPKPKTKPQPASDIMSSSIFDAFDAPPPKPKAKPQPASDTVPSSILDSLDAPASKSTFTASTGQRELTSSADANDITVSKVQVIKKEEPLNIPKFSSFWYELKEHLVRVCSASRLLREMARISSSFHGEPHYCSLESLAHHSQPPISSGASEVLHKPCDSVGLLTSINNTISDLKSSLEIDDDVIIDQALELLSFRCRPRRIVLSVLLQCLIGRNDLAEDTIRDAALCLMNNSELLGLSNDAVVNYAGVKYHTSSQWTRRNFGNIIWQLELCLWLHRGGTFDLSSNAAKETLLAVRVGLSSINWGRCYQSLDTLIKAEPDCPVDFDGGKNLWRSMKIIFGNENAIDCVEGVTSGGWEFLVDCRREEATEMLRDGMPGQFLIRPHPQDPGVFTLSFKTNLVPTDTLPLTNYDDAGALNTDQTPTEVPSPSKVIKRDDVVQHAIIRLTDTGFRCGSFGPYSTLTKLLHAVSGSLPFDLRFSDPPVKGIIKERGTQSSPNAFLFKKLALHSTSEFIHIGSKKIECTEIDDCRQRGIIPPKQEDGKEEPSDNEIDHDIKRKFRLFSQLLFLTELRKQLCAVAAAQTAEQAAPPSEMQHCDDEGDDGYDGSISEGSLDVDEEENLSIASRMVRPLLSWCRSIEIEIVDEIAPLICDIHQQPSTSPLSVSINASGDEFEIPSATMATASVEGYTTRGDAMVRNMIQAGSGVAFRTLRVGEPGNSVIVVLFEKQDAIKWLASHETGSDDNEAQERLKAMELMRVIEPITWSDLSLPKSYAASHPSATSRYRFVDPWEVEALDSKAGETASAALGRGKYQTLTVGLIASACEHTIRASGGLHLLGLWCSLKGGVCLTKALCSAHPSWERDAGGDLLMKGGFLMEPSPYENSIRQHLYGNSLFRSLKLPQRFLALVQVDLLDLKNVTTPSGSSSLTAYAMLRLKRKGSSAPLNHKARSLDSAMTQARKISKISGPNAPASWGSIVRFRFPLPEDVNCEGKSFDSDRESLFKGPPTCLQVTVYEKKFMSDVELGSADVSLDSLGTGGQIEEWVPLRVGKDGITWFARMRISLRFELMCLDSSYGPAEDGKNDRCPSVALRKIRNLSRLGAHEDHKVKSSISTPDLMGYFGNMLY
eukprot:CCRYP_008920-RA/>CCRYP_008920-RA protein AED:0.01 eAED:0.01 QI:160/1/1/1/1/1/3/904/3233